MDQERRRLDFDREVANFRVEKNPRQVAALAAIDSGLIRFLLYGGALGGGKSYFLRWALIRHLINLFYKYRIYGLPAMLACEDYPSLKDRQLQKIFNEVPTWLGRHISDHKVYGNCLLLDKEYGAGALCFRNLDDPSKYQSSEWVAIGVDELTKNTFDVFTNLWMRLRYSQGGVKIDDMDCIFLGGSNPGGPGHGWVKQFWMDRLFPPEWRSPIDYAPTFAYIPSKADDNPYLDDAYWARLNTLPLALRKAFRDGDWSTFIGQAFMELSRESHEYTPAGDLFPPGAAIIQTFDWGFGKPFSVGWWHLDANNRLYRAAEWYGWNGTADQGLHLDDTDIGKGMIEREKQMKISERSILRIAGPDCFAKKPNYRGGGQVQSTAVTFASLGLQFHPGDPDRVLKIRQFRERLRCSDEHGNRVIPMMLINKSCDHFWRTVKDLIVDKNNIEDVDTKGEDHVYDEACHAAMVRPLQLPGLQEEKKEPRKAPKLEEIADLERREIWKEVTEADQQDLEPF